MKKALIILLLLILAGISFSIEVEYHIYRGWNMLSVPCSTDAETIDELFPFLISTFVFDPAIQSYDFPSGVPAANEGFWAFSLRDTHITIECECVDVRDTSVYIYIADNYNNRIVRIDDMDGTNWIDYGTPSEFYFPTGIFIAPR